MAQQPQQKKERGGRHKQETRLTGLVRAVPSGDTVQIVELNDTRPANAGAFKEVQLTMLGLKAPAFGRKSVKDGKILIEKDQDWAFESREYLRKLVVGKCVVYRVEHEVGDRYYGEVWLNDENLRFRIAREGWADVLAKTGRKGKESESTELPEDYLELQQLKEDAEKNGLGKWSKDTKKMRRINYRDAVRGGKGEDELFNFFEKNRDKPLQGIVEQVRSGSTLRVLLTKSSDNIPLLLSGIRCPTYKFNDDAGCEPFSREAKFITEHFLLHRDVTVTIEGFDNFNNYFGTILDSEGRNICVDLLRMGLAGFVDWTAPKNEKVAKQFREAERQAQDNKLRLWNKKETLQQSQPQKGNSSNSSNKQQGSKKEAPTQDRPESLTGKVIEIVNAGTITVRIEKEGRGLIDRKLNFSSIIVPKLLNKREEDGFAKAREKMTDKDAIQKSKEEEFEAKWNSAYAAEAKEYLRSRLIGEEVKCEFDYLRSAFTPRGSTEAIPPRQFWSVYHKSQNIGVDLIKGGYAKVVRHAPEEARSRNYQDLIIAEKNAQKANKGIHGPKSNPPVVHKTDLTEREDAAEEDAEGEGEELAEGAEGQQQGGQNRQRKLGAAATKAQAFLTALKRATKMPAVVEYVFSGSRYKLWIPSQSLIIFFSLSGVNVPRPPLRKNANTPEGKDDAKFSNMALHFARDRIYQRNVEVSIFGVDKGGNFLGQLHVNKVDLGLKLVEEGLARLNSRGIDKLNNKLEYNKAVEKAQKTKLGLWYTYNAEVEQAKVEKRQEERKAQREAERQGGVEEKNAGGRKQIAVTEIIDGATFWYQEIGDMTTALSSLMNQFQNTKWDAMDPHTPKKGEIVSARFTQDDHWYRAEIQSVNDNGTFNVIYIDYGNAEAIKSDRIRRIKSEFDEKTLPRQAHFGRLAYIIPPKMDEEFGKDAVAFFRELGWGKQKLTATSYKDFNGNVSLVVGDPETAITINGALVSAGLARVERRRNGNQYFMALKQEEEKARKDHMNMWQYGDLPDSDDERM